MQSGFVRLIVAVSFFFSLLFSLQFAVLAQSGSNLTIRITEAPPLGGGPTRIEPLKARVTDPDGVCAPKFVNCRVALFSFAGGHWFPQPYLDRQLVEVDGEGLVAENIHLGESYAALVVRPEGYPAQSTANLTLPERFALSQDEAKAGARHPEDETSLTASSLTGNQDVAPLTATVPLDTGVSKRLADPLPPSTSSRLAGMTGLIRHPLTMAIMVFALVAIFLIVSGQSGAFVEALEYSLRELIHIFALRLSRLHAVIKVQTSRSEAARSLVSVFCFMVAIGAALASYVLVKFSFELLLPVGDVLTPVVVVFVVLKGAGGMLLHFFERRWLRLAVILALILAAACSLTVAYKRTLAIQELNNNASTVLLPGQSIDGVKVNEAILRDLPPADRAVLETRTPTADPTSSISTWLFAQEALMVAAITLVIDAFEIICIFAAFHLSANAVVWVLCLPMRLPIGLAKEGLWLIDRTKLTRVISVLIAASLEAPKIIVAAALKMIGKVLHSTVEEARKAAAVFISAGRGLLAQWRKREITRARRNGVVERARLRESRKTADVRGVKERADDRLSSRLEVQQRENEFDKNERRATLEHHARMNQMRRDKGLLVFDQNLGEFEALFATFSAKLADAAGKNAEGFQVAKAATVADEVTKALSEQFKKMVEAQTGIDGLYLHRGFQEQERSPVPAVPEQCAHGC